MTLTLRTALCYTSDAPRRIPLKKMRNNIDARLQQFADWLQVELDKYGTAVTFDVKTSVAPFGRWETLLNSVPVLNDPYRLKQYLYKDLVRRNHFNQCDPSQIPCIIFLAPPPVNAVGNMIGVENFGCPYHRPGFTGLSGPMAYLLAGEEYIWVKDRWEMPWFQFKWQQAVGMLGHEFVHCLCDDPHEEAPELADILDPDHLNWPNTMIPPSTAANLIRALTPPHTGFIGDKP